jgi:hypothetical protein
LLLLLIIFFSLPLFPSFSSTKIDLARARASAKRKKRADNEPLKKDLS